MIDYEKTLDKIIDTITTFYFEFDFEQVKKQMVLEEVSKEELERLGQKKVNEKFNNGEFKIQIDSGTLIDSNYFIKGANSNKTNESIQKRNPNYRYVKWVIKEDFVLPQLKKNIKNKLSSNTDIDLDDMHKFLLIEELKKERKIEGYIGKLPIISSEKLSKNKFIIQSTRTREDAINLINEVIVELKTDKNIYVKSRIKRDYKYVMFYFIFIILVTFLWYLNKQNLNLPDWISTIVGLMLFLIPLVVMRLINHSFFDALLFRKKAEKKYEKEFQNKSYPNN